MIHSCSADGPPAFDARRLFGSAEFRAVLDGENSDYWPKSVRVQRQLVVEDGEANGPGPVLPVPFAPLNPVASASSTLSQHGRNRYDPVLAFDGLPFTAWCEGAPGNGVGVSRSYVPMSEPEAST